MAELKVLNGGEKVTLIETFDSRALILAPGKRLEFGSLEEAKRHMAENGMEASISAAFRKLDSEEAPGDECMKDPGRKKRIDWRNIVEWLAVILVGAGTGVFIGWMLTG